MTIAISGERHLLPGNVISFVYTNWKGRKAKRTCRYQEICLGRSQMPDSDGKVEILLVGWDLDKQARRSYHVSGIEQGSVELITEEGMEMTDKPKCSCKGFHQRSYCPIHGHKAKAIDFIAESGRHDG